MLDPTDHSLKEIFLNVLRREKICSCTPKTNQNTLSALLDFGYICLYKKHIWFTHFPLKIFIFLNDLSDNYVWWGIESGLIIKISLEKF